MASSNPQRAHRASGFTLIEVLVVVAIIAMLVAILIPSLQAARDQAKRSVCATNLHQQSIAMRSYSVDFQGYLPYRGWFSYTVAESQHEAYGTGTKNKKVLINLGLLMGKHLGQRQSPTPGKLPGNEWEILYCPTASIAYRTDKDGGLPTIWDPTYQHTYGGYNYAVPMSSRTGAPRVWGDVYPRDLKKLDGYSDTATSAKRWVKLLLGKAGGNYQRAIQMLPRGTQPVVMDSVIGGFDPPHGGNGVNVMYSDGHVSFINTKRLKGLTSGADASFELWWYVTFHQ